MTSPAITPAANATTHLPLIIQGGMGVSVSDWRLARAVSERGHLGVVSGTGIDTVLVRRLQDGDADGHLRRAIAHFPIRELADEILAQYFLPGGRAPGQPYQLLPMYRQVVSRKREAVTILAAFVEVWLAREGHDHPVGINLLTKVQRPNIAALYGAMLAGVGYVLMGAGIPREIPAVLAALAEHNPASLRYDVLGLPADTDEWITLDPGAFWTKALPAPLPRPKFLAIVSSNSLATMLARKTSGIDGLVVEGPTAGGHNAPPRGPMQLNDRGEPIYGSRDAVDLAKVRELGLPFWIAGGTGAVGALQLARSQGATGIQVGTLFAFCEESGLLADYKQSVLASAVRGEVEVYTDPLASPTGYPFKVVRWSGAPASGGRERLCDMGYLRIAYQMPDGRIGLRCAAEPVDAFVAKGGAIEDTTGRRCLCNALMANVGLAQLRDNNALEPPLLTSGDDLRTIGACLAGRTHYSVADVLSYLLSGSA